MGRRDRAHAVPALLCLVRPEFRELVHEIRGIGPLSYRQSLPALPIFVRRACQVRRNLAMRAGTQAAASGEPALVSLLTLLETEWVLRSAAKVGRPGGIGLFKKRLECADPC
jgi:hypothetical protein